MKKVVYLLLILLLTLTTTACSTAVVAPPTEPEVVVTTPTEPITEPLETEAPTIPNATTEYLIVDDTNVTFVVKGAPAVLEDGVIAINWYVDNHIGSDIVVVITDISINGALIDHWSRTPESAKAPGNNTTHIVFNSPKTNIKQVETMSFTLRLYRDDIEPLARPLVEITEEIDFTAVG